MKVQMTTLGILTCAKMSFTSPQAGWRDRVLLVR